MYVASAVKGFLVDRAVSPIWTICFFIFFFAFFVYLVICFPIWTQTVDPEKCTRASDTLGLLFRWGGGLEKKIPSGLVWLPDTRTNPFELTLIPVRAIRTLVIPRRTSTDERYMTSQSTTSTYVDNVDAATMSKCSELIFARTGSTQPRQHRNGSFVPILHLNPAPQHIVKIRIQKLKVCPLLL